MERNVLQERNGEESIMHQFWECRYAQRTMALRLHKDYCG